MATFEELSSVLAEKVEPVGRAEKAIPGLEAPGYSASSLVPLSSASRAPKVHKTPDAIPATPASESDVSAITSLWLRSRVLPAHSFASPASRSSTSLSASRSSTSLSSQSSRLRPPGAPRPVTPTNVGLQLQLWPRLWPYLSQGVKEEKGLWLPVLGWAADVVVGGLLPVAHLWAGTKLLDLVEQSFSGSPVSWRTALLAGGVELGLRILNMLRDEVSAALTEYLDTRVSAKMEAEYLALQLGLTLQDMRDPQYMALVHEAGVFCGFESSPTGWRGPWSGLQSFGRLVQDGIAAASETYLVVRLLAAAAADSVHPAGNALLIALSLAPAALQIFDDYVWNHHSPYDDNENSVTERNLAQEEDVLRSFASSTGNRQEVVLFGLKGYVLRKWEQLKRRRMGLTQKQDRTQALLSGVYLVGQDAVQIGFYVLLATRAIPTSLTLGSIHLHKAAVGGLLGKLSSIRQEWKTVFQMPYLLAALVAAKAGSGAAKGVDYETHRGAHGMRIEARGLGYTYEGASKPAISGINLTIEPGESLAIVGFNGGGKSTLVKALLGLYSHSGELLINGREMEEYDAQSVHRRQSALFQDYAKYPLSLRSNVGFGDAERIDDDAVVERAVEKGGAEGVLKRLGSLERVLNPYSVTNSFFQPSMAADGEEEDAEDKAGEREDDDGADEEATASDPASPLFNALPASLSGGQWQRVALARAFMRSDADLVVFDEPSASLDPRAEAELFDRIHSLSMRDGARATTTIFISHRFSTVRRADRIAFVDGGTITEYGSHAELMALGGKYCELFTLQRKAFDG